MGSSISPVQSLEKLVRRQDIGLDHDEPDYCAYLLSSYCDCFEEPGALSLHPRGPGEGSTIRGTPATHQQMDCLSHLPPNYVRQIRYATAVDTCAALVCDSENPAQFSRLTDKHAISSTNNTDVEHVSSLSARVYDPFLRPSLSLHLPPSPIPAQTARGTVQITLTRSQLCRLYQSYSCPLPSPGMAVLG